MTLNSQSFIDDVEATKDALREASVHLAKYITSNQANLDESQKNDLSDAIGALTIQISALHSVLQEDDMNKEMKDELLASAKQSVKRTAQFLIDPAA